MNIAILSPERNAYSETFIQAHKKLVRGKIFYYYGSLKNKSVEGKGRIKGGPKRHFFKIKKMYLNKGDNWYYNMVLGESLKKNKIDLVLAEYGPTAELHLTAIKKLRLPLIVHFHGYDASKRAVIAENKNYKSVFDYAIYIVVVSQKMKNDLINLGCHIEKIILNPCGPNPEFFEIEPKFLTNNFLSVGRFVDKKAPYYLILSFFEVQKIAPESRLLMVGKGYLWETCRNLARALKIEDKVIFLGVVGPEIIKKHMSQSLAFVQHSLTADDGDSEGTPVSVLEASAAGLPVIATKHAGILDAIEDQETGLLVEEHDIVGMAIKMKELILDKEKGKRLGRKGKENIRSNFSLDQHITILDNLIEKALR